MESIEKLDELDKKQKRDSTIYYKNNKKKRCDYQMKYYQLHKNKILEYNRTYFKKYYEKNKEKINEPRRKYFKKKEILSENKIKKELEIDDSIVFIKPLRNIKKVKKKNILPNLILIFD